MRRYTSLSKYRSDLIRELGSIDKDIINDAVWNSEDHLRLLMKEKMEGARTLDQRKALNMAVADFGSPQDIADAYRRNM